MRCTAGNQPAAISAKRARPPTAKRCATMRTIRTSRRGSSPGSANSRRCTRSRWSSTKCTRRSGATSRGWGPGINVRLNLKIWRQAGPGTSGKLVDYAADHISPDMSFLEMLDVVNEGLIKKGEDAIAFDSDCREGICGMCSLVVNGIAHGPDRGTTVCQLHM